MKFATSFLLSASVCAGLAQTNLNFQNCQTGDTVKVKCDYEQNIATLRDFMRRSEAGEKIDFGKPVP